MSPLELLNSLRARGVRVRVVGDRLQYRGPADALDAGLRSELMRHARAVACLLREEERAPTLRLVAGRTGALLDVRDESARARAPVGGASGVRGPCICCRGRTFWHSRYGLTICRRCHPPAPGAEAADA